MTRCRTLNVEVLEPRDVPATLVWTGSDGGLWSESNNWTVFDTGEHRTPDSSDTLVFGELNGANNASKDDIDGLTVAEIDQGNTFTGKIDIDSGLTLTVSNSFTNYGTVTVGSDAILTVGGTMTLYGDLEVEGSSGSAVGPSLDLALLDIVGAGKFSVLTGGSQVSLTIDTLTMATGTSWDIAFSADVVLTGNVSSEGDITIGETMSVTSLEVIGNFSNSSGELVLNDGAILKVDSNSAVEIGNARVTGSVTIDAATVEEQSGNLELSGLEGSDNTLTVTGDLNNSGGHIDFTSVGLGLHVEGNFSQFIGTLDMQFSFASGETDSLMIDGSASLGGNLNYDAADAATAPFAIAPIRCLGTVSGNFETVTAPEPPAGSSLTYGWVPNGGETDFVFAYTVP